MKLAGMNLVRVFKDAEKVICDDDHVVLFCVKFIDAFNTFYTGFDVGLRKKEAGLSLTKWPFPSNIGAYFKKKKKIYIYIYKDYTLNYNRVKKKLQPHSFI